MDAESLVVARHWIDSIAREFDPTEVAVSPDAAYVAFPDEERGISLLGLGTSEVRGAALPDARAGARLLGWLLGERIAYQARDGRVLLARPGDTEAIAFPSDPASEAPVSCRPDGGALLCRVERTPMISMYQRLGALVRYADGGREDLDFVKGHLWGFWDDIAVWMPAPGLAGEAVR